GVFLQLQALQVFVGHVLAVRGQVVILPVGYAFDLAPIQRAWEQVFDVDGRFGVMGQLFWRLRSFSQSFGRYAQGHVPVEPLFDPLLVQLDVALLAGLEVLRRLAEILDLHLLEFARAEGEVSGRDLVAEGLADLRDAERELAAHHLLHVGEIGEDALRGLGAQISDVLFAFHRADRRLEHQIEVAWLRHIGGAAVRAFAVLQVVGAVARFAFAAIYERVGKRGLVTRIAPDQPVHQDRRVQTLHVVAVVNDRTPPRAHHVVLQLDAQRAVIPGRSDATVNFRIGEDEAASLAQAHDPFHAWSCHLYYRNLSIKKDVFWQNQE